MPTDVGQIAPMFSGPNPKGEILQLKDLMGKITLIDFGLLGAGHVVLKIQI